MEAKMDVVIARCNGTEIVESGAEVRLVWKTVLSPVWVFVAALCAFVLAVNGTLQLVSFGTGAAASKAIAGAVMLLAASLCGVACRWALRKRAADAERPGTPFLILRGGRLLDPQGRELATLAEVRLERTFQLGSSSKALTATWPGGSYVVARGDPFGGSVDGCEAALLARGLRWRDN